MIKVEQAFLPVHDKGQTEMSDPPDLINHNGRSLTPVTVLTHLRTYRII